MKKAFYDSRRFFANVAESLLGIAPRPLPKKANMAVESFVYGFDNVPSSGANPNSILAQANLGELAELAEDDPAT